MRVVAVLYHYNDDVPSLFIGYVFRFGPARMFTDVTSEGSLPPVSRTPPVRGDDDDEPYKAGR